MNKEQFEQLRTIHDEIMLSIKNIPEDKKESINPFKAIEISLNIIFVIFEERFISLENEKKTNIISMGFHWNNNFIITINSEYFQYTIEEIISLFKKGLELLKSEITKIYQERISELEKERNKIQKILDNV